ncbi:hypothetical protein [Salinarimonas rosea]|uniref:hypothetical protein n=1 Tax=Salinarimonas rosea TaxID=552063 RepID=UPI0004135D6A|nr:hypothetical protein [Salinarimonas rosea]
MSEEIALHHRIPDDERPAVEALRLALRQGTASSVRLTISDDSTQSFVVPPSTMAVLSELLDLLATTGQATVIDEDREIGLDEAAHLLSMSRAMLAHRLARGDVPHVRTDEAYRLRLSDVLAFREIETAQRRALAELGVLTDEAMRRDGG